MSAPGGLANRRLITYQCAAAGRGGRQAGRRTARSRQHAALCCSNHIAYSCFSRSLARQTHAYTRTQRCTVSSSAGYRAIKVKACRMPSAVASLSPYRRSHRPTDQVKSREHTSMFSFRLIFCRALFLFFIFFPSIFGLRRNL